VTVRSCEKQDRDGDCDDDNQQRIDAPLRRGSVGVDFWGHGGLRGVFWGSGEVFRETLKNWQGNFLKFFTKNVNILESVFYDEKERFHLDLGVVNS